MQPEFILVAGANGSGKTTLIERNRSFLEAAGFQIIIPDNILKYATSLTDAPSVIQEYIDNALSQRSNFVLESPFQFESLINTIDRIKEIGYGITLYQLYVKDLEQSVMRVKDRYNRGGLYIDTDQVRSNFNANFKNVANQYYRFDHSYFIDSSTKQGMQLTAEFKKALLIQYRASPNLYLKELFEQSALKKKINKQFLKIIQANQDYPRPLRQRSPRHRLKF